jgi:hypothetical protein
LMALAVVPLTALFVGMLGMAEVVVGGLDVHVLAPMGHAFLGLLVIGPAGLVVAVPAAVAWSQLTRLALRRVAARPSAPVLDP